MTAVIDPRNLAYLEAMEIPLWVPREQAAEAPSSLCAEIQLGPGSSGILLICDGQDLPASPLAHDIVRVLPETPVWAWPADPGTGQSVAAAVGECLFTRLLVFGGGLAEQLFGKPLPDRVGPARLMVTDDLGRLASHPAARKDLWKTLCQGGLVRTQ